MIGLFPLFYLFWDVWRNICCLSIFWQIRATICNVKSVNNVNVQENWCKVQRWSQMIINPKSSSYSHTVSYMFTNRSAIHFDHFAIDFSSSHVIRRTALGLRPTSGSGGLCHGSGWRLGSSLRFGALLLVQSCPPSRRRMGPGKLKDGGFLPRLGHFRVRLNSIWFNVNC